MRWTTETRQQLLSGNIFAWLSVAIVCNGAFAAIVLLLDLAPAAIVLFAILSLIVVPLGILVLGQQGPQAPSHSQTARAAEVWLLDRPLVQIAGRPSIAVLPFWTGASDSRTKAYAAGLAEEISSRLVQETNSFVTGRNSCCTIAEQHPAIGWIGEKLGVRHVLTGELSRAGDVLSVAATLWDTATNKEIWTQQLASAEADVFNLVGELAARSGSSLFGSFVHSKALRLPHHLPDGPESWLAYVQASALFRADQRGDHPKCIELCRQSIAEDARFARPHSLLAYIIALNLSVGVLADPLEAAAEANREAEKALKLDPSDPEVAANVCQALLLLGHHERALEVARLATIEAPNSVSLAAALGLCQIAMGHAGTGLFEMRRALRCSPLDEEISLWLLYVAMAFTLEGDYAQAAEHASAATSRRSGAFLIWLVLANALALEGHDEDAISAIRRSNAILPSLAPRMVEDRWQSFFAASDNAARLTEGLKRLDYASILTGSS